MNLQSLNLESWNLQSIAVVLLNDGIKLDEGSEKISGSSVVTFVSSDCVRRFEFENGFVKIVDER